MLRLLLATVLVAGLAAAVYFFGVRSQHPAVATATGASASAPAAATGAQPVSAPWPPPSLGAYVEGHQYRKLLAPAKPADPKTISVDEFFWYGCPHCFRLEPLLASWRDTLPPDVRFERVPDNLGRTDASIHERAFYAAQLLGIEDQIHEPLMSALVVQKVPLVSARELNDFFIEQAHIKPGEFAGAYNSFAVDADVQRADQMALNYQVSGVPVIVVGGEYETEIGLPGIFDAHLDEDTLYKRMLDVATFLIEKVRTERTNAGG